MALWDDLDRTLSNWVGSGGNAELADTVSRLAAVAIDLSSLIGRGALAGHMAARTGVRSGLEDQKTLDVAAHDRILDALSLAPVAAVLSEELEGVHRLRADAPLLVAIDPIDGSSNIDANVGIGTIFSILPADCTSGQAEPEAFLQPGTSQLAAGFFLFGPSTTLALTLGDGTQLYTLDRDDGRFLVTRPRAQVPASAREYAINTSNYRHWPDAIRTYVDDCRQGAAGPRGRDLNMRWTASPVADLYRVLVRGGVFLYPGDARPGYRDGRLRLIYEANPFALLIEQAGGAASSGRARILEIVPSALHQHVPFIAGARDEVDHISRLIANPHGDSERSPLFSKRGLFRL